MEIGIALLLLWDCCLEIRQAIDQSVLLPRGIRWAFAQGILMHFHFANLGKIFQFNFGATFGHKTGQFQYSGSNYYFGATLGHKTGQFQYSGR